MILTIPKEQIAQQLCMQLSSHFFVSEDERQVVYRNIDNVLAICENNFRHSSNKYFRVGDDVRFNPYHSVQYMTFLYCMAHSIYCSDKTYGQLCDKIYYLNKIFNSVDLFYAIELPKIWSAEHPLGSVMGRAKYGNGFFFYQGCTVGGTRDKHNNLHYPTIGNNVCMYSNSSILGNCHIGDNVNIGAGAIVKNQDVPDNCNVFGESPNLIIKQISK